jgi:putative acetyltransferase
MIRPYRADDLPSALVVWEAASAVGHPFLSEEFLAAERVKLARVYLPAAETWVWDDGGRLAGFISLVGNEVGGLFVDPALHGRGIGRALVDHARRLRGDLEVEVFRDNALGRAFYAACGFAELREGVHEETGLVVIRLGLPGARPLSTPGGSKRS